MKIFRNAFFCSAIFLMVFSLGSCTEPSGDKGRKVEGPPQIEGNKAADFELPDLEGKPFRLSKFRGKPVLLIFSTTWCGYCRSEIPHFRKIHESYNKQGLEVVQIFVQESQKKVSSFARQYDLPYRVLLDEQADVAAAYGVRGVPDVILLDREGKILCRPCRDLDNSLRDLFGKPQ